MIFTPACGWGVSISSGCCSVSHLVLTIHSYCHGNSACVCVCVCVCVWVGGGGGGGAQPTPPPPPPPPPPGGPCLPPPTFLEENLIICLRRCHFVGKDTYGPCYRNGPATPATQLTVVPSHFQFCSHWPDKSLKN